MKGPPSERRAAPFACTAIPVRAFGACMCGQRAQPVHTKAPHVASRAHGAPCVVERATCLLVNLLACAFRFRLVGAYDLIGMRLGVVAVQQHGLKEVQLLDEDS